MKSTTTISLDSEILLKIRTENVNLSNLVNSYLYKYFEIKKEGIPKEKIMLELEKQKVIAKMEAVDKKLKEIAKNENKEKKAIERGEIVEIDHNKLNK